MRPFQKNNFDKVVSLFQEGQPADFKHVPCEEFSSERCGGWIIKDEHDMYIGWVGNRGDVTYASYEKTTSETKFDSRGRAI